MNNDCKLFLWATTRSSSLLRAPVRDPRAINSKLRSFLLRWKWKTGRKLEGGGSAERKETDRDKAVTPEISPLT
ncbi:indole-3-acetic acid-amido synthetase GH3.5 [Musa troglodytarum]|uniref:Indole-3-acetic acid-amido synthetase GH3.5 n=1 Tax=Musa troglodytarum TaxID=320322 RepID=A0A9E7KQP9_9LILI|nr:indole-3-acetic acid-amido synthetase GH3.5 [Musa troglodytarum]URE24304.1 indole-3-acetic acid-amido synthetase GH3.5 [Musa troglodytarum]